MNEVVEGQQQGMIGIDPAGLSTRDNYKLLIGSVVPRPIALVTTLNKDAGVNAAPFSFFNIVSADPPLLSIAIQRKQGERKDTAHNAAEYGEFVVHIVDSAIVEQVNETAASLAPNQSELDYTKLTAIASERITVPGIKEAKIRMECKLEHIIPLGGSSEVPACDLLIGKIVYYQFDPSVYDERGYIDSLQLQPISRLAGSSYAGIGDIFSLDRPQ